MEFNEFREKVKESLPDFLTDDLRNAEIKDTAVNKLQGESYTGISVTPEGSRVGVSINLEDVFLDYQTGSQFTAVMNRLADTIVCLYVITAAGTMMTENEVEKKNV